MTEREQGWCAVPWLYRHGYTFPAETDIPLTQTHTCCAYCIHILNTSAVPCAIKSDSLAEPSPLVFISLLESTELIFLRSKGQQTYDKSEICDSLSKETVAGSIRRDRFNPWWRSAVGHNVLRRGRKGRVEGCRKKWRSWTWAGRCQRRWVTAEEPKWLREGRWWQGKTCQHR